MTTPSFVKQPVCLVVIDGWGISEEKNGNAIANADAPVMQRLCSTNSTSIEAHGIHVGLPEGFVSTSETGHMNIGAGRVVYQDILRINSSISDGTIMTNETLVAACNNAKAKNGRLHFLGLVSDAGINSHIDHLYALIRAAKHHQVPKCFVQFFSDGHDTNPTSGVGFVESLLIFLETEHYGQLASITGRFYTMDRDKHWDRVKVAYEGLVGGRGEQTNAEKVLDLILNHYNHYNDGLLESSDEFLKPIIVTEEGLVKNDDTLIFFNFRDDRMCQITEAFGVERRFETDVPHPSGLHIACMTQYDKIFPFPVLFPPPAMKNVLAEWLSKLGVAQFHCAETVKYRDVTYYFNGKCEAAFPLEDWSMEPSPKEVENYDLKPEMNCMGVAKKMVEAIGTKKYPFVMCNFAPPDMVGRTTFYEATVKACEATDKAIGLVLVEEACKANGYLLMVTADHGNAEKMISEEGGRTCNPVPFASAGTRRLKEKLDKNPERRPALCDVAPSVLDAMGLPIPDDMTGESLLMP